MAPAGDLCVAVIPGDGVGPEVVAVAQRVLEATGLPLTWETCAIRAGTHPAVAPDVIAEIRRCGVALKGPIATPQDGSSRSPNVELRQLLWLAVQVRRARSFAGAASGVQGVDVIIVRETMQDLYAGLGVASGSAAANELRDLLAPHGISLPDEAAVSLKFLTPGAARRTWEAACSVARSQGIRELTAIHKAAVMPHTDGLFLQIGRDVVGDADDLELRVLPIDTAVARLITHPTEMRLAVTLNLYGDVLADAAGALAGGVAVVAGANFGDDVAVFEAAHGAAFRHAGKDSANPLGAILSGAWMLAHLGEREAAARIERAVVTALAAGIGTRDLMGEAGVGTRAFGEVVANLVSAHG